MASLTLLARGKRKKKKPTTTIATVTGIVPDILAAQVADEVFKETPSLIPKAKSLIATLSSKAEAIYRTDTGFAKSLSDATTGRDILLKQMRGWAADYVKDNTVKSQKTLSAAAPKLPKIKRGALRYVQVTDKRDGTKHKVLTSVMPGTGFPVIYEMPSNKHRAGQKRGMLLTHDKIVKGEVHASREHFEAARRQGMRLEQSQGLPEAERSRYYPATVDEITASTKENEIMSSVSTLIASGSVKKIPTPASSASTLITAKTYVKKPSKKASAPPAASKSLSGLQIKLDALTKKYPGVTFEIQTLKTKKNQIKVSGLGKLTQKELFELFKAIPNTNHIPNRMAPGTAYFTLFGKKEITASDETVEAAAVAKKPKPYYVLLEKAKDGKLWSVQFGDKDRSVVKEEMADYKEKEKNKRPSQRFEYTILQVANAKQKTIDEAVKALTASMEAPGKSLGSVASLIAALPVSKLSASEDKFAALKKDDVVFIRSLNKPTHRVVPVAWNTPGGHVIKASYLGTDNKGSLRLFCDTGITTSEGHGPVTVPKEWVSLEHKMTASILLNPNVGDTGVVYRDPSSTDSEFAASDHEGQGTMLNAKVLEVKGQRLRVRVTAADNSVTYKNAWIFATHLYKNPITDATKEVVAELDADMIDGYVMQHIATNIRTNREPQTYVDAIRSNIKNVEPKDVDEALDRLNNDGIITVKDGKIYPSSDLMEVYASNLAQRSAVEHAKKEMESARAAHERKPSPMTRKRLDVAKRTFAKHLKMNKVKPLTLDQGPPKAKRTAKGVQVTAAQSPHTLQALRQALVVLKRRNRKSSTPELLERIKKLNAKIAKMEKDRVAPHQHATHEYEKEQHARNKAA